MSDKKIVRQAPPSCLCNHKREAAPQCAAARERALRDGKLLTYIDEPGGWRHIMDEPNGQQAPPFTVGVSPFRQPDGSWKWGWWIAAGERDEHLLNPFDPVRLALFEETLRALALLKGVQYVGINYYFGDEWISDNDYEIILESMEAGSPILQGEGRTMRGALDDLLSNEEEE